MACFIVPIAEATAVNMGLKMLKKRHLVEDKGIFSERKLNWLKNMLWASSFVSIGEHIYHGEIIAQFPFFTALRSWESIQIMLSEIAVEGVLLALVITGIWAMVALFTEYVSAVQKS